MIRPFNSLLTALAISWLALVASPVQAAGTASYSLTIAECEEVVMDPTDMMAQKYAAWKTQQELLAFRDYPYFQINNTSTDPNAAISTFRITIDPSRPFNFDTVFYIEKSPGITYSITSPDTIQGGARADFIDLTFTGFTQDKFFRFRSDIDNDFGNVNFFTDYRTVLTDAGGYSAATNALVEVDFTGGMNGNVSTSDRIPGGQLMGPFMTGTNFQLYHAMDMVQPYLVGSAIPEPTSWMAAGSILGVAGFMYRRRRNATATK